MSMADEAYRACQNAARAQAQATGKPVATDAVLTRHALESFLHRLTLTEHADSFVLKGGVLLAAYDYRRTTRDVDSNAVAVDLTAGHVEQITRDLARRRGLGHIHRRPHRARPAHHHHRPGDR